MMSRNITAFLRGSLSIGIAATFPFGVSISVAHGAPSYVLTQGKQYEVCREYLTNLQLRQPSAARVSFEWQISQQLKNLRKPNWKTIDAVARLDVVQGIVMSAFDLSPPGRGATPEARSDYWDNQKVALLEEISRGTAKLESAQLDFDGDGVLDSAFRFGRRAYVIDEKLAQGGNPLVGWWYWFEGNRPSARAFSKYIGPYRLYDSFLFKGRFYLSSYSSYLFNIGQVSDYLVFEPKSVRAGEDLAMVQVCTFRYTNQ